MHSVINSSKILARARDGAEISPEEALLLLQDRDPLSLIALQKTADFLRSKQVGETVTYVLNRNINFTNICEQHCNFCAFRRDAQDKESFWLDIWTKRKNGCERWGKNSQF